MTITIPDLFSIVSSYAPPQKKNNHVDHLIRPALLFHACWERAPTVHSQRGDSEGLAEWQARKKGKSLQTTVSPKTRI